MGGMMYLKSGFSEMVEFGDFIGTYGFWNPIPKCTGGLWNIGEGLRFNGRLILVLSMEFGKLVYPLVEYLGGFGSGN